MNSKEIKIFNPYLDKKIELHYKGNISILLNNHLKIGIIGSRNNSDYGALITKEIIKRLNKDIIIISGLARGIDGLAHYNALKYGLHTIGIIGSGLDYKYPNENEKLYNIMYKNELVISEYDNNEPIRKKHFVERNRLIAAFSDILIVIESKKKSGTHITVNYMLDFGKEIYVVPHNLNSEYGNGNNYLILEGANIIYDIEEFCSYLNQL